MSVDNRKRGMNGNNNHNLTEVPGGYPERGEGKTPFEKQPEDDSGYKRRNPLFRPRKTDAIVYATALEEDCRVVTSDTHFKGLEAIIFIG